MEREQQLCKRAELRVHAGFKNRMLRKDDQGEGATGVVVGNIACICHVERYPNKEQGFGPAERLGDLQEVALRDNFL